MDEKKLYIQSNTEFLIFTSQNNTDNIEVKYEENTLWMTQKMISLLFGVSKSTLSEHFKNIFITDEVDKTTTVRNFRTVQLEGNKQVERNIKYYNLDVIISAGYRINSKKATEFRRWATSVIKKFSLEGYVIDKNRMENGAFIGVDYFEKLLEEIREIRISERSF